MNDADCSHVLLNILTTRARRFVDFNFDVFWSNYYLVVVIDFWQDFNKRKRGVTPMGGIKRRQPHEAMNTFLAVQIAISKISLYGDGN